MWGRSEAKPAAVILAALVLGLAGCGDDDDDETTGAQEAVNGDTAAAVPDLDRFLMREGEEPGFRPGALPGALPRERETITGVDAFVEEMGLTEADAERLREEGFISVTLQPIRGPQSAGITNVAVYESAAGARHSLAHDLRPDVIRSLGPIEDFRYFRVPGIPGARGWTASKPHVGNVFWVQGRCMLVLGNQGPGPFEGPLSEGARAIYERTNGDCP